MNLVTGATGFIGSHLLYQLARLNRPVKALFRNPDKINQVRKIFGYLDEDPSELMNRITWVQGDITNAHDVMEQVKDVSCVYHVAGLVSFANTGKDLMYEVNVKGTEHVVNACLEHQVDKLCHVSSIATLGDADYGQEIDENVFWQPESNASPYAYTKNKGEMEVWRGIQEGLDAVIVNPSLVVGPGIWLSAGAPLFTQVYKGLRFYPEGSSGYVDVRDVAEVMIRLTDQNRFGERFILSSQNIKHRDFINEVADALHKKRPDIPVNPFIIKTAYLADQIRSFVTGHPSLITKQALEIAAVHSAYSNQKIRHALGIDFIPVKDCVQFAARIFLSEQEQR